MSSPSDPQPAPKPGKEDVLPVAIARLGNWSRTKWGKFLVDSLIERAVAGEKKYGTRLQSFNGRDALIDAFQEAQDAVMYLNQRLMESANSVEAVRFTVLLDMAEEFVSSIAYYIHLKERDRVRDTGKEEAQS